MGAPPLSKIGRNFPLNFFDYNYGRLYSGSQIQIAFDQGFVVADRLGLPTPAPGYSLGMEAPPHDQIDFRFREEVGRVGFSPVLLFKRY